MAGTLIQKQWSGSILQDKTQQNPTMRRATVPNHLRVEP